MKRLLLFLLLVNFIHQLHAQDTLWVKRDQKNKFIEYKVGDHEDIFSISKKFKIPPARLADDNQTDFRQGVKPGSKINIAIENFNYIRINSVVSSRPIYIKTTAGDDLRSISRLFYIPQSLLQEWNDLKNPQIAPGQILQVGWIAFESSTQKNPSKNDSFSSQKAEKTAPTPTPELKPILDKTLKPADTSFSPEDLSFQDSLHLEEEEDFGFGNEFFEQTNGFSLNSESGAGVFYPLNMSMVKGQYYAMHAFLPRGTIIQVESPANNKIIYAKVIGQLPKINKYHNAVIALSSNAKAALGLREDRFFCKIRYR